MTKFRSRTKIFERTVVRIVAVQRVPTVIRMIVEGKGVARRNLSRKVGNRKNRGKVGIRVLVPARIPEAEGRVRV